MSLSGEISLSSYISMAIACRQQNSFHQIRHFVDNDLYVLTWLDLAPTSTRLF